jgi:soluble P-type ATPase
MSASRIEELRPSNRYMAMMGEKLSKEDLDQRVRSGDVSATIIFAADCIVKNIREAIETAVAKSCDPDTPILKNWPITKGDREEK